MRLGRVKKIHLVGIGGTGMCGIAEVLIREGFLVTGSDQNESDVLERLRVLGCRIFLGHRPENVQDADVLVYSSAIPAHNPEVRRATELAIPAIRRGEMLAELMRMKVGVAVAGAHGKTTTTTFTGYALEAAGYDPTVVVGGRLLGAGGNSIPGRSENMVVEADESDGSFLLLQPAFAVVTNIDREHLDHYGSYDKLKQAFVDFMNRVPFWGAVIACVDDEELAGLIPAVNRRVLTCAIESEAEIRGALSNMDSSGTDLEVTAPGRSPFVLRVPLPGRHNACNALAAASLAIELGSSGDDIAAGFRNFGGIHRRMEIKYRGRNMTLFDDYGHHPREIAATVNTLKEVTRGPVTVVFQPHRFTRTRDLWDDFAAAFARIDRLFLTEIYPAGEEPIAGITGRRLADAIAQKGVAVSFLPQLDTRTILDEVSQGVIVTMGAGSITGFSEELAHDLAQTDTAS